MVRIPDERIQEQGLDSRLPVYRQSYEPAQLPSGVEIVRTRVHPDENGGHFLELVRLRDGLVEALQAKGIRIDLKNGQVNSSVVAPGTERFGHLHPTKQDELWMLADGRLTVAMYDLRTSSSTLGLRAKVTLSPGVGIYIPHGVVHGLANYGPSTAVLIYFPTEHFSAAEDTLEWRLLPEDPSFWSFARPDPA